MRIPPWWKIFPFPSWREFARFLSRLRLFFIPWRKLLSSPGWERLSSSRRFWTGWCFLQERNDRGRAQQRWASWWFLTFSHQVRSISGWEPFAVIGHLHKPHLKSNHVKYKNHFNLK
jgi:hypothetical protein